MKVDIDCVIHQGEAEISISLVERINQERFEEYASMLRREGFQYDSYNKSNSFTTKNPKMLAAMLKFLDKEFEVQARLEGEQSYTWDQRDLFVKDFARSLESGEPEEPQSKEPAVKKNPQEPQEESPQKEATQESGFDAEPNSSPSPDE